MENIENSRTTLLKLENYNNFLDISNKLLVFTYINIISEYLLHISENIVVQDKQYFCFVVKRGLETIKHVFNILLLYTKNLDLTIYHAKKAYLFYVEFIGQIGQDNHSYLKLNSKDAILFVYKKTIFEIHQDIKKKFTFDKNKDKNLLFLDKFTLVHNEMCLYLINDMDVDHNKIVDYFMYVQTMVKRITEKIVKNKLSINDKILLCENFLIFKDLLVLRGNKDSVYFLNLCNSFIKKNIKNKTIISKNTIVSKMNDVNISNLFDKYSYSKFSNWMFD